MSCKSCMKVVGTVKGHKGHRRRRVKPGAAGSSHDLEMRRTAQMLGAVGVLGKPLSWDELMGAVASAFPPTAYQD